MKIEKFTVSYLYDNRKIKSAALFTFIAFFLPSFIIYLLLIYYFNYLGKPLSRDELFALTLALIWTFIGPYITYIVFEKMRALSDYVVRLLGVEKCEKKIIDTYIVKYDKVTFVLAIVWSLARIIFFRNTVQVVMLSENQIINFFVIIVAIFTYFFISWLQMHSVSALLILRAKLDNICKAPGLLKKMLLEDYSKGLRPIGELLMAIIVSCATGALFFPIYMLLVNETNPRKKMIVICAIILSVILLLIFLIVQYNCVFSAAQKAKKQIVDEKDELYEEKLQDSLDGKYANTLEGIRLEQQVQNIYQVLVDVEQINTQPIDIASLSTVFCTIIIPLILYIQDIMDFFKSLFVLK